VDFLVTGVGSLPHTDPQRALELIKLALPEVPHWPQLPRVSDKEGFTSQYIAPLIDTGLVKEDSDKGLFFDNDSEGWIEALTAFYELHVAAEAEAEAETEVEAEAEVGVGAMANSGAVIGNSGAIDSFAFPQEYATGYYAFTAAVAQGEMAWARRLKGQLSGPLTIGFQVNDADGRPCFYNDQLRQVLTDCLASQARWQARHLKGLSEGAGIAESPIISVDDPGLYSYGQSTYVALGREEILASYRRIIDALRGEGAMVSIHVCAGADWSIPIEAGFDMINIDVYGYFDSLLPYAGELQKFLSAGGRIAWGLVPTSSAALDENTAGLLDRLKAMISRLAARGVSEELLWRNMGLTPSCGTGTLEVETAEVIYRLLAEVGQAIKQSTGSQ